MSSEQTKRLTSVNWTEADPASLEHVGIALPGTETPPWPDRLEIVLGPRLAQRVPSDITGLFEAAQGAMAYGYFYYPLYTFGADHLYRALEAAIASRARTEGYQGRRLVFAKAVTWLVDKGVMTKSFAAELEPLRTLRNEASHPGFQSLVTPGMAIAMLKLVAEKINQLFREPGT